MTNPDLAALSEAYTKSPNALSLTLLGHALVDEYRAGRLVQIDEGMRERVARVIADSLGDDYDMVPLNKGEWIKARGMCGGFPRDINAPFRLDYDHAADAAIAEMMGGAK